jgi:hypothetical protein
MVDDVEDKISCHAVPLDQPDKANYDRFIGALDVCFTVDEYSQIQKSWRELLERCGDRCK